MNIIISLNGIFIIYSLFIGDTPYGYVYYIIKNSTSPCLQVCICTKFARRGFVRVASPRTTLSAVVSKGEVSLSLKKNYVYSGKNIRNYYS